MNKRTLIILIVVIGLVLVGWYTYSQNTGPRIQAFSLEKPELGPVNFVVTGYKLKKIEIVGVSASSTTKDKNAVIGSMELVESSQDGSQTWILEAPAKALSLDKIYAQGYTETGTANQVTLPYKGSSEIINAVWPNVSQAVLVGTVKDITKNKLTMGVSSPANAAIIVKA
jgi:hypothetical protein